jgi:hypothetical protein
VRKCIPIVSRQLSKPEELREAGLGFTLRYGRAGPVCRFISPETQDAAGRHELLGEPLPQSPRDQIGNPFPTLGATILGQNPPFVASHLRNSDREQNGFGRGTGHDTAGEVIRCSIAALPRPRVGQSLLQTDQ